MAELILSPILQVVIDRLASPVLEKLQELYGFKQNFERLQHSLPMIQALLDDAEDRQVTDKSVKLWLSKLKDVAYDSDDLLDELATEITLCERQSTIGDRVRSLLHFEPTRRLFDIASELQKMLKVLDKVIKEGLSLNLKENARGNCTEGTISRNRDTGSFVVKSKVYGREQDMQRILEVMLPACEGKASKEDVMVIPIIGIGGIGKTTLARLVYNDDKLIGYFDLKIWVYVSVDFDVKRLIKVIVESATRGKCEFTEMDMLQSELRESLCGKRFLLVLDDVWVEDPNEWEKLGDLLCCGVEGSKVIVTTRSDKVASLVGTASSYHLKGLREEDCWALFKERAFPRGDEDKYPKLVQIGTQILKKCAGVPLAATTLGSLKRLKREEKDWLIVEQSELCMFNNECQSGILQVLRLSYNHLPAYLKRCFAYCSLFPKNYEFKKDKLIHLWMAEGFILSQGGDRQLEDIGSDYFNDLLQMSFFQEVKNGDDAMTVYKMHDIIHDLVQSVGGNEYVKLEQGHSPSHLARARHCSIVGKFESSAIPQALLQARRLRTLLLLSPGVSSGELPFLPSDFTYLRVLNLSGSGVKFLQKSISELISLRYLDLSNTLIQVLPESISDLCNLQTLDLSGCYQLVKLPSRMDKLISLRHLDITGCEALTCMPAGIGKLMHLQTWPIYIVGNAKGQSIEELKRLKLRGELIIKCLENVKDAEEATAANLKEKNYLQTLSLLWGLENGVSNLHSANETTSCGTSNGSQGESEVEDIINCLEPHSNLSKLFVRGYPGSTFPKWALPNLTLVVLINCKSLENLPALGELVYLKTLYLQGMNKVKCISREFYSMDTNIPFPSLKELTIRDFPSLKEWSNSEGGEVFPCLEKLVLSKCPNLTAAPFFLSLRHLELQDCHPMIIESMERLMSLSILVIDGIPQLSLLGKLLKNNNVLTSLKISGCQYLCSLPSDLEELKSLKSLTICSCKNLSTLPEGLQKLQSLQSLEITDCQNILSLPDIGSGGLSSLKVLSIESCSNLYCLSAGLQHLIALEQLTIIDCPSLLSLPDNLQNLAALRSLSILCCQKLDSLPESLQHVTALQTLEIRSCPSMKDLPEWVGKISSLRSLIISDCENLTSLPDGLQSLSKLQHLSIQDCPNLESWCKKVKGRKGWCKVSHIPHIYIGSPYFQK